MGKIRSLSSFPAIQGKNLKREEFPFFAQGGAEIGCRKDHETPSVLDPLERTLFFKIRSTAGGPFISRTAILFGAPNQAQPPLVTVSTPQIGDTGQEMVRNDSIANPFYIQGLKILFPRKALDNYRLQKIAPVTINDITVTGKSEVNVFQTAMGYSPSTVDNGVLDFPTFEIEASNDIFLQYEIFGGQEVWMQFTIKRWLDNSKHLFGECIVEIADAPRQTGIPLYDMMQAQDAEEILKSGFNSVVKKAFE